MTSARASQVLVRRRDVGGQQQQPWIRRPVRQPDTRGSACARSSRSCCNSRIPAGDRQAGRVSRELRRRRGAEVPLRRDPRNRYDEGSCSPIPYAARTASRAAYRSASVAKAVRAPWRGYARQLWRSARRALRARSTRSLLAPVTRSAAVIAARSTRSASRERRPVIGVTRCAGSAQRRPVGSPMGATRGAGAPERARTRHVRSLGRSAATIRPDARGRARCRHRARAGSRATAAGAQIRPPGVRPGQHGIVDPEGRCRERIGHPR